MTTDDDVLRLFRLADPARVDDPAPVIDADGYLDSLLTMDSTVTLIDNQPSAPGAKSRHRSPIIAIVAAAAAVVVIVVGALVVARRDKEPTVPIPADRAPTTTVAGLAAARAEGIARGFLQAENAYDANRALTYLSDSYLTEEQLSPQDYRRAIALNEAMGNDTAVNIDCEQQVESETGHLIRCFHDYHLLRSDELGLGPYHGRYTDVTVRGGKIVAVHTVDIGSHSRTPNPSSAQMWEPFRRWIVSQHPDDAAVMYDGCCIPNSSRASIALWEQRTREYVARTPRSDTAGRRPEASPEDSANRTDDINRKDP